MATCQLTTSLPLRAAVLQFLLSPLLLWRSFMSTALANALYAAALCHYHYLNFLGYSALPFLERTEVSGGSTRRRSSCTSRRVAAAEEEEDATCCQHRDQCAGAAATCLVHAAPACRTAW